MTETKEKVLSNGVEIPVIGFGTYKIGSGEEATKVVEEAITNDYRLIDTAAFYGDEKEVGEAIKRSETNREDLFLVSKVWTTDRGYEKTRKAFEKSLEDLQTDYLDLYLIHWPAYKQKYDNWEEVNRDTWQALIDLYQEGKVRAIGVCNFKPHHLKALMEMEIKPMVNQIEYHPGTTQEETVEYCKDHGIVLQAWSPLGRGRVFEDPVLIELSEKYSKSIPQLILRWEIQNGIIPIPKSTSEKNMKVNLDVFNFEISEEDMNRIDRITGEDYFSGLDPDTVDN